MSRITDLQLNGCLPAMSGPPWPEHALHLPHLSHLELVGPIAHVSGVLHQIRLARACTLRVLCEMSDDPSTDAHDVSALVRALHQTGFFGSSAHKPGDAFVVRALSLSSYVEDRLDVSAWRTPCCADDCSALLSHKDAQLSLDFEWPETPAAHERRHSAVAAFVCRALPLAALEVLLVESLWFGWSADKWRTLFGRCANVRSVHSGHVDAIALLHALLPPSAPGPPSDGGASEVLFPSLSSVSVFHADFSGLATGGSAEAARDWLRRLFEARRAMGHPVAKLLVGKNDSTRDWAAGLRDVVSVLWLHEVLAMGRDTLFTSTDWQAYDWIRTGIGIRGGPCTVLLSFKLECSVPPART
ncbi:hypothetical protein OF83DRAFT_1176460 [Amylostereum chailletii]|nr:hypothetical protein OF83DRAFT_1176460 [Amylostereum chailletii]